MGRWETPNIKGSYYAEQMETARTQGRVLKIPSLPAIPVNTFWDLGWNDTTAIWFRQRVGMEHRSVDYIESSGKERGYFAKEIQDRPFTYGTHYLPHDAENKTLASAGKSVRMLLQDLLPAHRFDVVPRTDSLVSAINQTRAIIPACYFDEDRCADAAAADSPRSISPKPCSVRLLGLFGLEDKRPSPADAAKTEEELKRFGKTYEFHSYENAGHAFFAVDRPQYRVHAAIDGWKRVFAWFGKYLR